jgi:hypothetical protein
LRSDLRAVAGLGLATDLSFDFAAAFDLLGLFDFATRFDRRAIDTLHASTWTPVET